MTDHRPHCFKCHRPIGEGAKKEDEPILCGPCYHKVVEEAGRKAVRVLYDKERQQSHHADDLPTHR